MAFTSASAQVGEDGVYRMAGWQGNVKLEQQLLRVFLHGSMGDTATLSEPGSDVKAWLNDASARKAAAEPMDRYLAELEMRLHLKYEDLDAELEEESARAAQNMPGAVQDISRLKGEIASLNSDVHRALGQLEKAAAAAEQTVAFLVQLDLAKSRMEAASSTLKEATELAEVFNRVDAVFAGGNLQAMASVLGTMQRGLTLVGNVPEFAGGLQRLEELQQRFHALLEPELMGAMSHSDSDKVRQLAGLLQQADQHDSELERLYVGARIVSLQHLWDSFKGSGQELTRWIPHFFSEVLSMAKGEIAWSAASLPQASRELLTKLLLTFFEQIESPCRKRFHDAVSAGGAEGALAVLATLLHSTGEFLGDLKAELASSMRPPDVVLLMQLVAAPLESQLRRYAQLEAARLREELEAVALPSLREEATEVVVGKLRSAVPTAVARCQEAMERCWQCSLGTELPALGQAVDQALAGFIGRLTAVVQESSAAPLSGGPSASSEEAAALLPLLHAAHTLHASTASLKAELQRRTAGLATLLDDVAPAASDPAALVVLRLRSQGRLEAELRASARRAEEAAAGALRRSDAAATKFADTAQALIYDALMQKLRAELSAVPELPSWTEAEPESKMSLPSFSAYPQAYATAAGEYLMMLPQMLEALLATADSEDGQNVAVDADWLDKVAAGAADLYVKQLSRVHLLSDLGSQQLAADLEYFCNVLSALGVAVPTALGSWQLAAQWRQQEFTREAAAAMEEGVVDKATIEAVARARRIVV